MIEVFAFKPPNDFGLGPRFGLKKCTAGKESAQHWLVVFFGAEEDWLAAPAHARIRHGLTNRGPYRSGHHRSWRRVAGFGLLHIHCRSADALCPANGQSLQPQTDI